MDNWLREFEDTSSFGCDINRNKSYGGPGGLQEVDEYRKRLDMLQEDLQEMVKYPKTFKLSQVEAEKRNNMLQQQYKQLSDFEAFLNKAPLSDRESLMGKARPISRRFGESEETADLKSDGLLQLQQHKMKVQDETLGILSKSIARQKEIALGIEEETEIHLGLLDNLDTRLDKTTTNVKKGAKQIEKLERKSSTCTFWVLIILLLVVMLILALV